MADRFWFKAVGFISARYDMQPRAHHNQISTAPILPSPISTRNKGREGKIWPPMSRPVLYYGLACRRLMCIKAFSAMLPGLLASVLSSLKESLSVDSPLGLAVR